MTTPTFFQGMFPLWREAQVPMQEVGRWSNFVDYPQNSLQHAYSVQMLADFVLYIVKEIRPDCDCELVRTAIRVHDLGEPGTGGDVLYEHKHVAKDVREVERFFALTDRLPRRMREEYRKAFLLQFCLSKDHAAFLLEAQGIMRYLRDSHAFEARVFDLIERLDYLTSAYEGHQSGVRNEDETMIEHTVGNQVPKLDRLVYDEPHLAVVWSPQLSKFFNDLVTREAAE